MIQNVVSLDDISNAFNTHKQRAKCKNLIQSNSLMVVHNKRIHIHNENVIYFNIFILGSKMIIITTHQSSIEKFTKEIKDFFYHD